MTQRPLILAVETSGRSGSVAIAYAGEILGETCFSGRMRHNAELFAAISGLLSRFGRKPEEVKHVYISAGPGSFTGLRIAVVLAKMMYFANSAKIVPVDTLDVISANAEDYVRENNADIPNIAVVLDAKRGRFYVAVYRHLSQSGHARYEKTLPDCLMTASEFLDRFAHNGEPIWLLGEGLMYHKNAFEPENVHFFGKEYWEPRASKVYSLGWQLALKGKFADPVTLQPNYLLMPEAKDKWQQKKSVGKD